jgi:hypothetical protein
MNISKDEARILAVALAEQKYDFSEGTSTKEEASQRIAALQSLVDRLDAFGLDKRRQGRTSQDSFADVIKRYVKQHTSL